MFLINIRKCKTSPKNKKQHSRAKAFLLLMSLLLSLAVLFSLSSCGNSGGDTDGTKTTDEVSRPTDGPDIEGNSDSTDGGTSSGGTSSGETSSDGTSSGGTSSGGTSSGETSTDGTSSGGTSSGGTSGGKTGGDTTKDTSNSGNKDPVPPGAIEISKPEQLAKIGKDKKYPLDGDYVLTANIDLSGYNNWTPIGGAANESGIVSGSVFRGTFDGRGHIISGLKINAKSTRVSHFGLFGSIGSGKKNDPCVIKNIIFTNVKIEVTGGAFTCAGALAGQASGYVEIDNISLMSGSISAVISDGGEILGAGGLIGQCRTDTSKGVDNKGIYITNIINNITVYVSNGGRSTKYCSGIIGRIRASNIAELSDVVNIAHTTYESQMGYAITSGDSKASICRRVYYLTGTGDAYQNMGTALTNEKLTSGNINLSDKWIVEKGSYPLPSAVNANKEFNILDMIIISFASGESAESVKSNFKVPTNIAGKHVTWKSSDTSKIKINGENATVYQPDVGFTEVTLTASCDGKTRTFKIIVKSNVTGRFENKTAQPGDTLTVVGFPSNSTYTWTIRNMKTGQKSSTTTKEPKLKLTSSHVESLITVSVAGHDDISIYCSNLPVVYINSDTPYRNISKASYSKAEMTMQGTNLFSESLYNGEIKIKLRGNSTAERDKRPFKIKLDKKENLLGIGAGANKHWTLLANDIDHTLMRNKLLCDFSGSIGTEVYMHSENVVLIYNGEHYGVYQLCEHVRIGEARVNVFDWEEYAEDAAEAIADALLGEGKLKYSEVKSFVDGLEAQMLTNFSWIDTGKITYKGTTYVFTDYGLDAPPKATGGFLLEMDFYSKGNATLATLPTAYYQPLYFNTPSTETVEAANSLKNTSLYKNAKKYIQTFEYALHSDDFFFENSDVHYAAAYDSHNTSYKVVNYTDDEHDGYHYSQLFDMDSLVNNFIFCEFAMNWDSMKNSFFLYKDIDGLAKIGPQWDFDWAWGNRNMYWINTWYPTSWHTTENAFTVEQYYQTVQWNRMLIRDPYFLTLAYEKWHQIRGTVIEDIVGKGGIIEKYSAYLKDAAEANDKKWSYSYSAYGGEKFQDALNSMLKFINTRLAWLDKQFESIDTLVSSLGYYATSDKLEITGVNTGSSSTTVIVTVNDSEIKTVTFQINGMTRVDVTVSGGKASYKIDNSLLRGGGALNCVEVKAKDAEGKYIVNTAKSKPGNCNVIHGDFVSFSLN